ncbi:rRNA-processing protein EFG1 [Cordyceps fumosorosea ARSEF 2679]|uniref:rRNA-processing protein EFG1 n=1 Tax=Cordyceps fumosorosea (strain ARSEF 2679) TaxID=1081104 RepID=A0A168ES12_CORFA|nr:rRNA-processing protein EFG1 [Cordyceps fumosorosea ARSEF 2679]OAA74143.1 rRNA-processing protein EFG1 [Cordyceps fumosorosea ARSEF 2679]
MDENSRDRGPGGNASKKHGFSTGRHKAKQGSAEWAKKRTRSIQRMMSRNNEIPANLRNEMERELAAHKNTISDKSFQRRRSAMISKYHMVRFFERKKAERLVKQLKRELEAATDDEERSKIQANLHMAQVDEAYTIHHPHAEVYISLYGSAKKEGDEAEGGEGEKKVPAAKATLAAERPPMWKVVERAMEEGPEALKQLRERRSATGDDDASASQPRSHAAKTPPQKERMAKVIAKQAQRNNAGKATGDGKTESAAGGAQQSGAKTDGLNRRERRRLMREAMASTEKEDEDDGFFEM